MLAYMLTIVKQREGALCVPLREHCCRLRLSWDEHALFEDDLQVKEDFWVSSTPRQRKWRYGGVSMVTMVLHRNSGRNAFNKAAAMRLLQVFIESVVSSFIGRRLHTHTQCC